MLHFGMEDIAPFVMYYSGVFAFFAAMFWRADIGLYYLLPLIPIQTVRYWLNPFPLGQSVIDLMILAITIGLLRKGEFQFPESPTSKLLLRLIAYSYVSCWLGALFLGSDLPFWFNDARLVDWKNYITLPVVYWLTYSSLRKPYQIRIAMACMALSILMLNRSFFDGVQGRDMSTFNEENRVEGAMGYAGVNGLAAFQAQLVVALLAMSFYARHIFKIPYLALGGFSLYCLAFAFSRGGYAGFLVGWFFLGVKKNRLLAVLMVIFLATWQEVVPTAVMQRVTMTTNSEGQLEHSAELRVGLWEDAADIFSQNPITGTGMFTYAYRGGKFANPHNYYVQVMVEGGIIGMYFFLSILYRFYQAGMELSKANTQPFLQGLGLGLAAWITAAAATNFFGDRWTFFQVNGYMWVLGGFVERGLAIHREEEQQRTFESAESEEQFSDEDADFEAMPEEAI